MKNFWRVLAPVLAIACFLVYANQLRQNWKITQFDDAYMFVRYANQLLDGHGMSWNSDGMATYGATSLPYVWVLAGILKIFPGEPGCLMVALSWFFGLIGLVVVISAVHRVSEHAEIQRGSHLALLILPPLIFQNVFFANAFTGMDTTLSFLANAFLIFCALWAIQRDSFWRVVFTAFAAFGAFLVRPDNGWYALLFPTLVFVLLLKEGGGKRAAFFFGCLSVFLLIDSLVKYQYFGHIVPLGVFAKKFSFADGYLGRGYWNPIEYLDHFFKNLVLFLLVLVVSFEKEDTRLILVFLLPCLLTFASLFQVSQIMGFDARFYCPSMVYLIACSLIVFDRALRRNTWEARKKGILVKVLVLGLFYIGFPSQDLMARYSEKFLKSTAAPSFSVSIGAQKPLPILDWWEAIQQVTTMAKGFPAGTVMAATEVGYLGAEAKNIHLIDMTGLNDERIARQGFSLECLLERNVEIIWFPPSDYSGILYKILSQKQFLNEFEYYPQGFNYGLALRKNTPHFHELKQQVKAIWENVYPSFPLEQYVSLSIMPNETIKSGEMNK